MEPVDVLIIGTGQGAVPLATELAGRGQRVVIFERARPGGSCINYGCTPSKAFLAAAHAAGRARHSAHLGVHCEVDVDFGAVMRRVRAIRDRFTQGVSKRLESAGVRLVAAEAGFTAEGRVVAAGETFEAPLVVLDTGSRAAIPPVDGLADTPYLTDGNFWEMETRPERVAVIGGGYVGLELGQGLARLGSQVRVFERGKQILANEAADVAAVLHEPLTRDGIQLHLGTDVDRVSHDGRRFTLEAQGNHWEFDALLVATGRTPNTRALNAEAAGIELDDRGYVRVDDRFQTSRPGVYAIGEVAGQPAFTHVAWEDYRRLLTILDGGDRRRDDRVLGYSAYTEPQVARAGLSRAEAESRGYQVASAEMAVADMARGIEWGYEYGFFRIVAERGSGRLLGAELVGYETGELVHLFIALIEQGATLEQLGRWQFIHPTYAENLPTLARMAQEA